MLPYLEVSFRGPFDDDDEGEKGLALRIPSAGPGA